ncbi:type VI secretion system baseplate subunit TssF [Trinickia sp. LjRoot230]|uniref:type VI secretion system baseplate subunit TssF n=1 Tax=Trinickia sp. LjRoot230 TaxID=3342288 RepID=UPI003ED06CED
MNPAFVKYYSQELSHLREMGAEFAAAFPKIAGRLGLEKFECADPYVERLLEGFSFLAARVQMQLDAQFPRFTQHLTEIVFPHLLAPIPSMVVARFMPDFTHPRLAKGVDVPRQTALVGHLDKADTTRCEYRTGHQLTLWPLELVEARYSAFSGAIGDVAVPLPLSLPRPARATLRLRFETHGIDTVGALALDRLPVYLPGSGNAPVRLYEHLTTHVVGALVVSGDGVPLHHAVLPADCIAPIGFADDEALLPNATQSFEGFRLIQEYFAFSERYLFVELRGLRRALQACNARSFDVVLLLDNHDTALESSVDATQFALYCTPAINLFPKRADRIAVTDKRFEYHVVADRTRPLDFEIHSILGVDGYRSGEREPRQFAPFYRVRDGEAGAGTAFFQMRRDTRLLSERERRVGARSRYVGSEAFIALVDSAELPVSADIHQLGVSALCTNRDLPLRMRVGGGATDFTFAAELPVAGVRCVAGPSEPRPPLAQGGDSAWRLIDGLSRNFLPLTEGMSGDGAAAQSDASARALRSLLSSYCAQNDDVALRQIAALQGLRARPVTRRLPLPGPVCFGRGLEVTLEFADAAFTYEGGFLLGAVLQAFFSAYVAINHFTETAIRTPVRGEVARWQPRIGQCAIL